MSILFTGHRGFLGRELIPNLSTNYKITTYDGDLCDFKKLKYFVEQNSVTKIIHAAARVGSRIKQDTVNDLIENLKIALNISKLGIPVLSFCSGKIYGYQESIDDVLEGDIGKKYPEDFYGQSKFLIHELFVNDNNIKLMSKSSSTSTMKKSKMEASNNSTTNNKINNSKMIMKEKGKSYGLFTTTRGLLYRVGHGRTGSTWRPTEQPFSPTPL